MITEILDADLSIEPALRFEMRKQKRQSRREFICEVIGWLTLIAFLSGMLFAITLSFEMGLKFVSHEIAEHVRTNHGF